MYNHSCVKAEGSENRENVVPGIKRRNVWSQCVESMVKKCIIKKCMVTKRIIKKCMVTKCLTTWSQSAQ